MYLFQGLTEEFLGSRHIYMFQTYFDGLLIFRLVGKATWFFRKPRYISWFHRSVL